MANSDLALAEAAAEFNDALAAYARLGELFLHTPLSSVKQLERANATLAEIAACEERLQAAGQRMVQALASARSRQEELAAEVVAHVPAVQARNQQLHDLLTRSPFDQAYLHLSLEQTIYVWTRSERWQLVKGSPPAPAGSELWFKGVLRDPEWLRDPAGRARVEAQKVLDELAAQRRKTKEPTRADC